MNLFKSLLALSLLISSLHLVAQESTFNLKDPILDPASTIPASPTVANLIDFENIPVNYYTGQPDITIPLFSKKIHQDITIDLKLGYSSNGVKINNKSGWVGTGWSLSGLGVISKTVKGIPDEQKSAYAEGLWHRNDFEEFNQAQQWKTYGENGKKLDAEYDVFNAVYPGGNVEFIIESKDSVLTTQIINSSEPVHIYIGFDWTEEINYEDEEACEADGKVWIEGRTFTTCVKRNWRGKCTKTKTVTSPPRCADAEIIELDTFNIVTASGKRYEFTSHEFAKINAVASGSVSQGYESVGELNNQVASSNTAYYTRSAWHLTGIYSGPTEASRLISITYQGSGEEYQDAIKYTTNEVDVNASGISYEGLNNEYNKSILKPRLELSFFTSSGATLKPHKIFFNDGTQIELIGNDSYTHPETGGKVLGSVKKFDRLGGLLNETKFRYELTDRLWLTGVDIVGSDGNGMGSYNLNYNSKENLPAFDSKHDIWGFIDQGDGSNIGKASDPIKTGLLASIEFPTGGKKEFIWEQHTFSYAGDDKYEEETDGTNPNNYVLKTERVWANDQLRSQDGTFFLFSKDFTLPDLISPTVRLIRFSASPVDPSDTTSFDENNASFRVIRDGDVNDVVFQEKLKDLRHYGTLSGQAISQGNFTAGVMVPNTTLYNVDAEFFINYKVFSPPAGPDSPELWLYGGGPRIKEIKFTDQNNTQRKWTYNYRDDSHGHSSSKYSSGAIDGTFETYEPTYSFPAKHYLYPNEQNVDLQDRNVRYTIRNDMANVKMTQGSYVGYQYVKVTEEGRNFVIYKFRSPRSDPSASSEFSYPFFKDEYIDKYRGALVTETHYQDFIVEKTEETQIGDVDDPDANPEVVEYTYETTETYAKKRINYSYQHDTKVLASSFQVSPTYSEASFQFFDSHQQNIENGGVKNLPPTGGYPLDKMTVSTPFLWNEVEHTSIWRKLLLKTTKDFFYENDLLSQKEHLTTENYTYDSINRQVDSKTFVFSEGDQSKQERIEYLYPSGTIPTDIFTDQEIENIEINQSFNRLTDPILISRYSSDGSPKIQQKSIYGLLNNGLYELSSIETRTSTDLPFDQELEILKVDDFGNILAYTNKAEVSYVHLYGYKGTKLLAVIQNASYSDVQNIITVDLDELPASNASSIVNTQLDNLRTALNGITTQVTTYHYNDKMQLDRLVDPNGRSTRFYYDDLGRLLSVVDHEGNLVKNHNYRFRN